MKKRTISCMLAALMIGITITSPSMAASVSGNEEMPEGNSPSENAVVMEEETVYSYSGALSLAKPSKFTIASQYRNLYIYGGIIHFIRQRPLWFYLIQQAFCRRSIFKGRWKV